MNITKALKLKNKLVSQMNKEYTKFSTYNSNVVGESLPYDALEAFEKWKTLSNQLIELKTKIHAANIPVYDKIFRMSELKSMISSLRRVNCRSGRESSYGGLVTEYESKISLVERDEIVTNWENEVEKLQEELEQHNALTQINFPY